jgi:hypothetical protein
MARRDWSSRQFQICAALFFLAALYHLAGAVAPSLGIRGAPARHAVFVGIDASFALLLLRRPWWLPLPLALLTFYSVYRHGHGAWKQWQITGQLDWIGVGVVVALPAIFALVVRDSRRRKLVRSC